MPPTKATISNDLAFEIAACLVSHECSIGGAPPVSGVAFELPAPMFWPPGFALGQNKLSKKAVHKDLPIVLEGHDCGVMLVHVQISPTPANVLTVALHIPFSGRKTNFFTSRWLVEGACVAAATLTGGVPTPMTGCWDPIAPPTVDAMTSHANSAVFSLTLFDLLFGWGMIAADILIDLLVKGDPEKPEPPYTVLGAVAEKVVPVVDKKYLIKQGVGVAAGALRMAATDGPASAKVSIGSPYLSFEAGVSRDAEGSWAAGAGGRVATLAASGEYTGEGWVVKEEDGSLAQTATREHKHGEWSETEVTTHSVNPMHWGKPL